MSTPIREVSAHTIEKLLGKHWNNATVTVYDSIDSTNSQAKRSILQGNTNPSLLIAKTQTGGRGRLGRSFYSPPESGLYMTLHYATHEPLVHAVQITSASAVAVMRALEKHTGKQTGIKWVNDLYYNGKKVCGILTEALLDPKDREQNHVIIGIGINLYSGEFPKELDCIAGSLDSECDPNSLIADIANEILLLASDPARGGYMDDYRRHSIVLGKEVRCQRGDEVFVGIAQSIDESGALCVRLKDNTVRLLDSGEVSLRVI